MSTKSILIVDDELDILSQLNTILMQEGFTVFSATNGLAGIAEFKKHLPPVCIIDYKMPGMDGLELLRQIKKVSPKSEVILISGNADMKVAVQALKEHAFDFLQKPVDLNDLIEKVNDVFNNIEVKQKTENAWVGGAIKHKNLNYATPISEITITVDLDEFGSPKFLQEMESIEHKGTLNKNFVVSMAQVYRINNIGLNALVDFFDRAGKNGYNIALSNVSAPVMKYFQMLGYDKFFLILKSTDNIENIFLKK